MGLIKASIRDEMSDTQTSVKEAENLPMKELLDLLDSDEKSNDSTESVVKKPKKKDMKSPSKKRKRLSDEEEDESKSGKSNDEFDIKPFSDDDDDMVSLEKLKEKTYNSVKKDIMSMDYEADNAVDNEDIVDLNSEKRRENTGKQQTMAAMQQLVKQVCYELIRL